MKNSKVKELLHSDKANFEVTVKGWVRTFRNNQFIALNDGSTIHNIQCVVDFENTPEETLKRITTRSRHFCNRKIGRKPRCRSKI
jgi:asparaginyl-tRNA synthetase